MHKFKFYLAFILSQREGKKEEKKDNLLVIAFSFSITTSCNQESFKISHRKGIQNAIRKKNRHIPLTEVKLEFKDDRFPYFCLNNFLFCNVNLKHFLLLAVWENAQM